METVEKPAQRAPFNDRVSVIRGLSVQSIDGISFLGEISPSKVQVATYRSSVELMRGYGPDGRFIGDRSDSHSMYGHMPGCD